MSQINSSSHLSTHSQPQQLHVTTNHSLQSHQQQKQKLEFQNSNSDAAQILIKTTQTRFIEPWTQQEIIFLFEQYILYGPKWPDFSKQLKKSQISVKNKFYGNLRKLCRRLSHVGSKILKPKNPINDKAFFKVFQARDLFSQPFEGYNKHQKELMSQILNYAKVDCEATSTEEYKELIEAIHSFNTRVRPYKLKRLNRRKTEIAVDEPRNIQRKLELKNKEMNREEIRLDKNDIRLMDHKQVEEAYNYSREKYKLELQVPSCDMFRDII